MATEKLKFKLELYATMWDKAPHVEIFVKDNVYFNGDVKGTQEQPTVIEFEHECAEDENYDLIIKRTGKVKGQTIVNSKGDIIKDQILQIKNIIIDEINIGGLVYEGLYTPLYPEPWATQQKTAGVDLPASFKNATALGHNGTWSLAFSSPFYMWLLENLY